MPSVNRNASEEDILATTLYAEARGEPREGQEWVIWVIKNRAHLNRSYWGGSRIKDVCLHPGQFECWNGVNAIYVNEPAAWVRSMELVVELYGLDIGNDPTSGSDHYINPAKAGYPSWTNNCDRVRQIGAHVFYRSRT